MFCVSEKRQCETCLSPLCRLFLGFAAAGTSTTCHAALACRRRQQTAVERSALARRPQQNSSDCIESLPVPGREGGPKSFQPPTFLEHGGTCLSPLCRLFLGFAAAGTSTTCHAALACRRRQQTAVERSALAQRPQQNSSDCIESLPVPLITKTRLQKKRQQPRSELHWGRRPQ